MLNEVTPAQQIEGPHYEGLFVGLIFRKDIPGETPHARAAEISARGGRNQRGTQSADTNEGCQRIKGGPEKPSLIHADLACEADNIPTPPRAKTKLSDTACVTAPPEPGENRRDRARGH
jgi:hypothetical protein